ncbi:hypothetical protein AAZX31_16G026600 [Glycine max]|uniref:Uncharacterized protein n=2 Tax=Glycine subgen. Soja TaxID=1462606 RepID=K7MEX6_SOYBN
MLQRRLLLFSLGLSVVHSQCDLKKVLTSHMEREIRFLEDRIRDSRKESSSSLIPAAMSCLKNLLISHMEREVRFLEARVRVSNQQSFPFIPSLIS